MFAIEHMPSLNHQNNENTRLHVNTYYKVVYMNIEHKGEGT